MKQTVAYSTLLISLLWNLVSPAFAMPLTRMETPEPLKPWFDWVIQEHRQALCPFFYNDFQQKHCAWAGVLDLNIQDTRGQFSVTWQVDQDAWVILPGDNKTWPQKVEINQKPATVMLQKNRPAIYLKTGVYQISGQFIWDKIPESLALPPNQGLLNLMIKQKTISYPLIKNDRVWLKQSDIGTEQARNIENKINVQVFRKIIDGVPLQMQTWLELEVSGQTRETQFDRALLPNWIPVSLTTSLPARIEPDGQLLVQVRPGRWRIQLDARHPDPITELSIPADASNWPEEEIWSFQSAPNIRTVEISGLLSIDPSQTNVPSPWRTLPAYLIKQNQTMTLRVIRRGNPEPEPNRLNLKRQFWLDFDGEGYTVSDTIEGRMTQGWRLNALPATEVGQVVVDGQNQLVTLSEKPARHGVELRKGQITLKADSRINGDIDQLDVTGWEQNFAQVTAELNLPPGWRLLAAQGVDNVPNSWLSRWTLLDLFVLLIASLAITRLWSLYWGLFAMLTLGLLWHEAGAPHWIWLSILAAIALLRVLPDGRFKQLIKSYLNLNAIILVIIVVPFMIHQVRTGLYPQLEKRNSAMVSEVAHPMQADQAMPEAVLMENSADSYNVKRRSLKLLSSGIAYQAESQALDDLDPDANIQTGPGLPEWQWHKVILSWNGAVDSRQQIHFWFLSPGILMLLNFLRVIFTLALAARLFDALKRLPVLQSGWSTSVILLFMLSGAFNQGHAAFPDQALLDQLQQRILQSPDCLPDCAQIAEMDLQVQPNETEIRLEVHAAQNTAIPLPGHTGNWVPNQVTVDGKISQTLIGDTNGQIWLKLDQGRHIVNLKGLNPVLSKMTLALPLKPFQTTVKLEGWSVEGVHENGLTESQLILTRIEQPKTEDRLQQIEPGALPAFIRIEKTLNLGVDWTITTRLVRLAQNEAAVSLAIPLIEGESVTDEQVRVKDHHVWVSMAARQTSISWRSTLTKQETIHLTATDQPQWTELWRLNISPIWHVETSGLSVIHQQNQERWLPEWRPWPGESVMLSIHRPEAVKGATLTIDKTQLEIKPGKRNIETRLDLQFRSSKGGQHSLTLPPDADLQEVRINGVTQPIRKKNNQLTLPIQPGVQQVSLTWRILQEQSSLLSSPALDLGLPSVNNTIQMILGQDRWVLLTSGPDMGPAVLFWGIMIVILLISWGLGRVKLAPLRGWQWFLLLIGLSQIPVGMALIVVLWFFALGLRQKKIFEEAARFNLVQVALSLLTLVALMLIFSAVKQGLLGTPDMQIAGNRSSAFHLNWYQDRSDHVLPQATIVSVSITVYRILMLCWSLWLAISLLNWLKWGWHCFASGGIWKSLKKPIDEKPKA